MHETVRTIPTLTSTPTGEHFEFLTSARASDGHFRFVWTLGPGRKGPPEHYHPTETETFEILEGTLRIWINGEPHDYSAGDAVSIPPMACHRFLNPTKEPAVARVTLDGTRMEDVLVPMALHFEGRTKIGLGDVGQIIVHDIAVGGSVAASGTMHGMMSGLAKLLMRFGIRPLDPVEQWRPSTVSEDVAA